MIRSLRDTTRPSRITQLASQYKSNTTQCFFSTIYQPCFGSTLPFDSHSYSNMLQQTIQNRNLASGKGLHCDILKRGGGACLDLFAHNILLNMYVQSESLHDASQLFDEMPIRNTISFITLAQGYSRSHQFDHALDLILRLELSVKGSVGAMPLKELVRLQGKDIHAKGSSLSFSSTYKLLFISFQDGTTLIGRPSPDVSSLVKISSVYEEQESKLHPAGLHHWKELLAGSGLFVCLSTAKSNSALAVSMGECEILARSMRHSVGSTSSIVGMTAYKPLSKDKIHCLFLHDDGSLRIYSHAPVSADASVIAASEKVKKLGSGILNKAYAATNPEFPLDFFEKTVCFTSDVKLGGDAIRNGDSEGAKQSLVNEDGFLESPSPAGFKISVSNSNPDIVMVGFRVHVGSTSASHIPSSISIFERVIKLDEGMRSWYDIPFTVMESLLADEEFTMSVGPIFNGSTLPRIDSLEVYGRAKDEFGWKEKMDAVLDMEARVLCSNSSVTGSGKKRRPLQSAPIQEQVIADRLKLITKFYSSFRQQEGGAASLCRSRPHWVDH